MPICCVTKRYHECQYANYCCSFDCGIHVLMYIDGFERKDIYGHDKVSACLMYLLFFANPRNTYCLP